MSKVIAIAAWLNKLWQSHPWFRRFLQWGAVGFPFSLMGVNLYQNWQLLGQYHWKIDPLAAGLSALCLLAAFLLLPLSTRQVMSMLNYELPYVVAYRGYFLSQLAKYLPGGIWIVPGRAVVLAQAGVSAAASGTGILIELYVLVVTGMLLFIPYAAFASNIPIWLIPLIAAGGALLLALLHTPLLPGVLAFVPWFRSVNFRPSVQSTFSVVGVSLAFWLLTGTGFFWLVRSVEVIGWELWWMLIAAYSMAWVTGFLVFLTPGGLGVREGALSLLLSAILPLPVATVVALLARVWWSLAEILCVGLASLLLPVTQVGNLLGYQADKKDDHGRGHE